MKGVYCKLDETIESFKMLLDGELDDLEEDAFYLVGTAEQAREKDHGIKKKLGII